jgi:hypothetical protein
MANHTPSANDTVRFNTPVAANPSSAHTKSRHGRAPLQASELAA